MKTRQVNGYILIYKPEHPRSYKKGNWKGFIYEHIVVAEEDLGRSLCENEVVHHLDEDKTNNRIGNLLILDRAQHAKLHVFTNPKVKNVSPLMCRVCGVTLQRKQKKTCSVKCWNILLSRQSMRPSKEILEVEIKNTSFSALGRKYNVSDNAVRKWARKYELI